jgi:DUF2075 family protein
MSVEQQVEKLTTDVAKHRLTANGIDHPEENLKHELNVLLKRGVHGLYIFAVDTELRNKLLDAAS